MTLHLPLLLVALSLQEEPIRVGAVRFTAHRVVVEKANVAAGDFNHGGHQDLVAAGEQLTIFLGDGTGELRPSTQVPGGDNPVDFAVADLNADGNVDIAVANHETDYLTLLLGTGGGEFRPAPNSPLKIDVSPHPHEVQAHDFDRDGHLDLIVDHRHGEGVLVLRGLGAGRFESPGKLIAVGGDPYRGMAVGDVNGDGRLDLVTPNPREVGILLGTAERLGFVVARAVPATIPFAVALGDFDNDGRVDLLSASGEGSPRVELFVGAGTGGFTRAEDSPPHISLGAKNIVVGDFNGDGIDDAAVTSYHSKKVLLVLGGEAPRRTAELAGGDHPWGLATADFNEDGVDDLMVGDDSNPVATVWVSSRR